MFKSEFLNIVTERGLVHQCTNAEELDRRLMDDSQTAYVGFDLTADSLHVGHLLPILLLRWWNKTHNRSIVLLGGGTTKVGDPSGRDTTRPILTDEQIGSNIEGIFKTFSIILPDAIIQNNSSWLEHLSFIGALRDIGRHFSVNKMLTMDSVKNRLNNDQNMSFLEFNYMVLQAFDFVELNKLKGCILQMGGSDQWGNITMGIDLCRRMRNTETFGLTSPLLSTASGKKMGKTADGAIWLNSDKLSVFDFWQFWRNIDDADVPKFLAMLTELPMDEVNRLSVLKGQEINHAKITLADEITKLVHGKTPESMFDTVDIAIAKNRLESGIPIVNFLVEIGLATSKSDARRNIQGRGIRLNHILIDDPNFVITINNVIGDMFRITHGKKKSSLVKVE